MYLQIGNLSVVSQSLRALHYISHILTSLIFGYHLIKKRVTSFSDSSPSSVKCFILKLLGIFVILMFRFAPILVVRFDSSWPHLKVSLERTNICKMTKWLIHLGLLNFSLLLNLKKQAVAAYTYSVFPVFLSGKARTFQTYLTVVNCNVHLPL